MKTGGSFLVEKVGSGKIFTPECFTDEQKEIRNAMADFASERVLPLKDQIEKLDYVLSRQLMKEAGELGFLCVDIPEKYGGLELDKITSTVVTEYSTLCQTASFVTTFSCHIGIGTLPIVMFGNDEQKQKYLPKLATGEFLGAYALTEPGSGSDALNARATAVLSEDKTHFVLNGTKQYITNAGLADTFIVFAKIDGEHFTAFIVEKDAEGLSLGPEENKMGLKGSSTCSLILENAKVPAENLLGEIGKGHEIAFNILNIGRFKLGAADLGACKTCITEAAKYALERKQFGQEIAHFDAIKSKIANMTVRTFALDTIIYRTVGMIEEAIAALDKSDPLYFKKSVDAIERYAIEASMAKIYGSESLFLCSDNGIQILGGYGFSEEYPMARMFRDTRVDRIFEGTNEINRQIVAGYFLKKALMEELPVRDRIEGLGANGVPKFGAVDLLEEKVALEWAKGYALYVFNEAICVFGQGLKNQHQIEEALADVFIDLYALDGMICRIEQLPQNPDGTRFQRSVLGVFAFEAMKRIEVLCQQILFSTLHGEMLERALADTKRFLSGMVIRKNVFQLKREIAEFVYDNRKYPF